MTVQFFGVCLYNLLGSERDNLLETQSKHIWAGIERTSVKRLLRGCNERTQGHLEFAAMSNELWEDYS